MFLPETSTFPGVSQSVWSQNQHSNPALLIHRVWHIHTGWWNFWNLNVIDEILESKEDLQWQQGAEKLEQLEYRTSRCPENNGPGRIPSPVPTINAFFLQNIDDVLQRGAVLSEMENKSQNLTEMSRKYRFDQWSKQLPIFQVHKGKWRLGGKTTDLQQHFQERCRESKCYVPCCDSW